MIEPLPGSELERALARPDVATLIREIDAWIAYSANLNDALFDDDVSAVITAGHACADKALAYAALAIARSDDAELVNLVGCLIIEDILREPTNETIARVVAEAERCSRFRWALSSPYKIAVADAAWFAIKRFRITGPHKEPNFESFPERSPAGS